MRAIDHLAIAAIKLKKANGDDRDIKQEVKDEKYNSSIGSGLVYYYALD
jgi:hypothetical protein